MYYKVAHSILLGRQTNHWFHSAIQILILGIGMQALEKNGVLSSTMAEIANTMPKPSKPMRLTELTSQGGDG